MFAQSLEDFYNFARDKKIAVLGAGISNRPLISWLYKITSNITVFDKLPETEPRMVKTLLGFEKLGLTLKYSLGENYLDKLCGFDLIFRTPNMRPDLTPLIAERANGAIITSEMALFLQLCPAPVTAITGSDGKTTTTTLISLMLQEAGYKVYTGGNIGTPLLDRISEIQRDDRVVVELSSFQLMDMLPHVHKAVVTNIIPNHLDFHRSFGEYKNAKINILRAQSCMDIAVLNAGNRECASLINEARGEIRYNNGDLGGRGNYANIIGDDIVLHFHGSDLLVANKSEVKLRGRFNLENIAAAALTVIDETGIEPIRAVAKSFTGVRHRLEFIRNLDGASWYNSSIDSSPDRTGKTLGALRDEGQSIVLISGGKDKNCDYGHLGEDITTATNRVVLVGQNAALIKNSILASLKAKISENKIQIVSASAFLQDKCCSAATPNGDTQFKQDGRCRADETKAADDHKFDVAYSKTLPKFDNFIIVEAQNYEEAVKAARALAKPNDTVILSPAGTSFDFFHHFEERGDYFCQLVRAQR